MGVLERLDVAVDARHARVVVSDVLGAVGCFGNHLVEVGDVVVGNLSAVEDLAHEGDGGLDVVGVVPGEHDAGQSVLVELLGHFGHHRDAQVGGELQGRLDVYAVGGLHHGAVGNLRGEFVLHGPLVVLGEVLGHLVHDEAALAQALHEGVKNAHGAERGDARDLGGNLDFAAGHVGDLALAVAGVLDAYSEVLLRLVCVRDVEAGGGQDGGKCQTGGTCDEGTTAELVKHIEPLPRVSCARSARG